MPQHDTSSILRHRLAALLAIAGVALSPTLAAAQDPADAPVPPVETADVEPAPADPEAGDVEAAPPVEEAPPADDGWSGSAEFSLDGDDVEAGDDDGTGAGGFLVGGKLGGGLAFSDLSAHPAFALELGYRFDAMGGAFGAVLDVGYYVPTAEGDQDDPRVPGGNYEWEIWQKQLILQPTFMYRLTMFDIPVVPYAGIGPRIYLLQTVERGSADGNDFPRSTENSTKVGFGLPLGVEYGLGPGFLFGEILIQWGPIDHDITGDSNLGTATLWLGYRAVL